MLLHDDPDNVDHSHQHQQNLLLLPSQSRLPLCCFGPFIIKCCAAAQINSLFSYTNETFLPSDITLTPTLAAVFFIAVVHAVQHVVAAPAPRDAVGPIQTQELVFSALLHTADLLAKMQAFSSTQRRHKGSSTAEPWRFMSPQPREHKRC